MAAVADMPLSVVPVTLTEASDLKQISPAHTAPTNPLSAAPALKDGSLAVINAHTVDGTTQPPAGSVDGENPATATSLETQAVVDGQVEQLAVLHSLLDDVIVPAAQPAPVDSSEAETETVHTPDPMETGPTVAAGEQADTMEVSTSPARYTPLDLSEAALRRVKEIREAYRAKFEEFENEGRSKPDMQAFSELKKTFAIPESHGHIAGVNIGDEFRGKGELAVLGIHKQIPRGIDFKKAETRGAYAIVLSGGYKDDQDEGEEFIYTGEGKQVKGIPTVRQDSESGGNLALRQSFESGMPVRVCRAKVGPNKERLYVYEGLYRVTNCWMEKTRLEGDTALPTGPEICRFTMTAIPGEAVASIQVAYKCWQKAASSRLQRLQLAGALQAATGAGRKRKRADARTSLQNFNVDKYRRHLETNKKKLGVKMMDLSRGMEAIPIPVINTLNDEVPGDIKYMTDIDFLSEAEQKIAKDSVDLMFQRFPDCNGCGVKWMADAAYTESGQLLSTHPQGVLECPLRCKGKQCKLNRVVQNGIRVPLQVFMTEKKGWGVKSPCDIPVGMFVCAYMGTIINSELANELKAADDYLFDLDHFVLMLDELLQEKAAMEAQAAAPQQVASDACTDHGGCASHPMEVEATAGEVQVHSTAIMGASTSAERAAEAAVEMDRDEPQEGQAGCSSSCQDPGPSSLHARGGAVKAEAMEEAGPPGGMPDENVTIETMPPLPGNNTTTDLDHLVVDAKHSGNVARFINHSCNGNLTIQPVLTGTMTGALAYYVGLFAARDIAAGEELCYDYGYKQGSVQDKQITCHCGAADCRGQLL